MTGATSQAEPVDRISLALRERREAVALQESRRVELVELIERPSDLSADYLLDLLRATWERMPTDLVSPAWKSPTSTAPLDRVNEVLAIGAAVADVFSVHEQREEITND